MGGFVPVSGGRWVRSTLPASGFDCVLTFSFQTVPRQVGRGHELDPIGCEAAITECQQLPDGWVGWLSPALTPPRFFIPWLLFPRASAPPSSRLQTVCRFPRLPTPTHPRPRPSCPPPARARPPNRPRPPTHQPLPFGAGGPPPRAHRAVLGGGRVPRGGGVGTQGCALRGRWLRACLDVCFVCLRACLRACVRRACLFVCVFTQLLG